jgi:putative ABC transport system permease protein
VKPVGRLLLTWRLVLGDIKRRPVNAALLLVMIVTTTTTLTLGLSLRRVTDSPFARTRAATKGPDVVAEIVPGAGAAPVARQFAPLIRAPGVVGTAGPYPVTFARLSAPAVNVQAQAEGRALAPSAIDQPALSSGTWIRPGGVVIERAFAAALRVHAGETIRVNGRSFRVAGIAASTAQCFYPVTTPGVIWLSRGDAERLATPRRPLGYVLDVKLRNPSAADAFVNGPIGNTFFSTGTNSDAVSSLNSWEGIEHDDFRVVAVDQKAMVIMSSLLALLALASIGVAVGGRMAEQTRRVGLLKAIGATPRLVAVVLLAENLLLAVAAAAVGVVVGHLLAPLLTNAGNGLLGTSATPPVTASDVAEVLAIAVAVASAATVAPAVRGARTSTIRALTDPLQPPKRRAHLIRVSSRLPVPLLFALRLLARRPRRAVLTAASLAIAVAMIVAALTLKHFVDLRDQQHVGYLVGTSVIGGRVSHLVTLLSAILAVLAAINAIFTTWATVIDAQRPTALGRALGATPRQITAGLTAAQLIPGVVASVLGIPAGLLLYQVAGGHLHEGSPPVLWLVAVIPATLIAVALLTAIPARIGARRPVAEILRAD